VVALVPPVLALPPVAGGGLDASALHASAAQMPTPAPNHFTFEGRAIINATFPYSGVP
jgi:hypothetical protein